MKKHTKKNTTVSACKNRLEYLTKKLTSQFGTCEDDLRASVVDVKTSENVEWLHVALNAELNYKIHQAAAEERIPVSLWVARACREYLANHSERKGVQ